MADYHSVIARAVSGLPINTDQARRAIYDRARKALQERLRTHDPPISETELANEQFALEAAIRKVEMDLVFSDMRLRTREGDPQVSRSFGYIAATKEFVSSVGDKFKLRDRLRSSQTKIPRLLHDLARLFLENTKEVKRLMDSSIRRWLK